MTAQDVADFYVGSLGTDWEHCREEIPTIRLDAAEPSQPEDNILLAHFFREVAFGSARTVALVSVNADGMVPGQAGSFEIVVDHDAYRNFCTGEDLR